MRRKPNDLGTETMPIEHVSRAKKGAARALLLAFTGQGFLGHGRCEIPKEGLILGRKTSMFDGVLLDDPQVSRKHAEVRWEGGQLLIVDLGSRNRTCVNGRAILDRSPLGFGDVIRLGHSLLVVSSP